MYHNLDKNKDLLEFSCEKLHRKLFNLFTKIMFLSFSQDDFSPGRLVFLTDEYFIGSSEKLFPFRNLNQRDCSQLYFLSVLGILLSDVTFSPLFSKSIMFTNAPNNMIEIYFVKHND